MTEGVRINQVLLEFEDLRARLMEAEQTLEAIRSGEVDALIVQGETGEQVFTLKGADEPYRVFLEQMQEGAATLNDEGVVLYANQRLAEMLQLPLERVIGCSLYDLVGEADRSALGAVLEVSSEANGRAEICLRCDPPVPVLLSVSRLQDQGELRHAATFTDLTEQKRNEEIVRSERLARAILDHAAEAIVVCDPEGRILRANAEAESLVGRSVVGQLFEEAFWPELGGSLAHDVIRRSSSGERIRGLEVRHEEADLSVSAGPLPSEGAPIGCVVTLTDTTEKNRALAEARDLNETLEARVVQRTEQLQLANHELEGFCYSVSHDLRSPLRAMTAASMMLIEDYADELDSDAREHLERLGRSAKRMGDLIDDLLKFSRLGRQSMTTQWIDLSALATEVVDDLLQHQDVGNIQFTVQSGMSAEGDVELLRMLYDNLIGNAAKFTRERENASITVGQNESGYFVADNGVGFDMAYVDKIFQPFERLHPKYPGTGIGLANVQRIVVRHGGHVWAQAKPNEGATFYFTLG